jgi:carboxyl-terminal processing protease
MGRTVYGGGGITPDLIVDGDTLTTAELQYLRTTAPKASDIANVEYDYTLELANQVKRGFSIDPAWRDEYFRRIQAAGATVDRSMFNAAQRYIDRNIEQRVSSLAEGDSTARRRDLKYDAQLRQAIAILEKAKDQRDLFSIATAMAPVGKPAKP